MRDVPGLCLAVQVLHQARAVALLGKTPFLLYFFKSETMENIVYTPSIFVVIPLRFFTQGPSMHLVFVKTFYFLLIL
jgi:hypothetical protein